MATFVMLLGYIIFIGLGIPDSILGSAWPAIYAELNLPVSFANFITILLSLFTIIASYFSARLINKFGTGTITTVSTTLTAVALIGFSLSPSIIWFCICAVPAGLGAGCIDAALNNYFALRFKAMWMSFLHCFYGVGVALSPFVMAFALSNGNWRLGYRTAFYIQIFIVVCSIVAIPLWNKVKPKETDGDEFKPLNLTYKQMLKTSSVRRAWVAFFSTCALEFTCGIWACTYLTYQGMAKDVAARFLTLYYIGMTSGRVLSGIIVNKIESRGVLKLGYAITFVAVFIIVLPVPVYAKGIALFFIGLGNGPTFPNLTYLTPELFGKEKSQSLIGSWLVLSNAGILLMPALFGLLADVISVNVFPFYLITLCTVMCISTIAFLKKATKEKPVLENNSN